MKNIRGIQEECVFRHHMRLATLSIFIIIVILSSEDESMY
jgi:hypothetical protein